MKRFKRPNVLLLYTDQQRFDTISYLQKSCPIETPNLNALAADGAFLQNYYVNNPVCGPSRISFLSGRYCSSLGVGTNGIQMPDTAVPLNQLLKTYGYDTAQIGKLHFDPHAKRDHRDPTHSYGFDTFILSDEPGCYDDAYTKWVEMVAPEQLNRIRTSLPPAASRYQKPCYSKTPRNTHQPYLFEGEAQCTHQAFVASEMIRYIESRDGRTPFFAIAGFYAPHPPLNPPKEYLDKVDLSKIRMPIKGEQEPWMEILRDIPEAQWTKIIQYYLALVVQIDELVGDIVKALKKQQLYEDTIIVFTSDHGEYLGDHGRIQKGMPGYDCIIHVPFLIKYTREIAAGQVVTQLTEGVDFVPTILDFCGIQIPRYIQGKSMRPLLRGETDHHKDEVLVEYFEPFGEKQTTLRSKQYKYYCSSTGKELFFDLMRDPFELSNQIDNPLLQKEISQMRWKMILRLQQSAFPNLEQQAEY